MVKAEGLKFELGGAAAFFVLTLLLRLPFLSPHLFDWDLTQMALGIHHFSLAQHQPQPPGYILFVGLGRLLGTLFRNDNLSFTVLGAVCSAASAGLVFILGMRLFSDRRTAVFAAVLWTTSPLVWFYGEVGETYAVGACAGLAFALATWRFWKAPNGMGAILSACLYALAAGIRQDLTVFLFPLWLAPYVFSKPCRRFFLRSAASFLVTYLAWYIPTVALSGGFEAYSKLTHGQFFEVAAATSIFLGGSPIQYGWMLFKQGSAIFVGLLGFWVVLVAMIVRGKGASFRGLMDGDQWRFLLLWAAPALAFFTFLYFAKLGYLLVCLAPMTLLAARWLALSKGRNGRPGLNYAVLTSVILINAAFFFAGRQLDEVSSPHRSPHMRLAVRALNDSVLTPTEDKIRMTEEIRSGYFREISRAVSQTPSVILVAASWGRDELSWRTLMYYYPDVPVYGIMSDFMSAAGPPAPLFLGLGRAAVSLPRHEATIHGKQAIIHLLGRNRLVLLTDAQLGDPTISHKSPYPASLRVKTPDLSDRRLKTFRLSIVEPHEGLPVLVQVGEYTVKLAR